MSAIETSGLTAKDINWIVNPTVKSPVDVANNIKGYASSQENGG